ncbi:hypothetical protein [Streptomyces sp. NPDC058664]|uniref:hypothetical protein n=1 Tax=unclassified Streptomyces TaxID=2593676 RepID=UPI00365F6271
MGLSLGRVWDGRSVDAAIRTFKEEGVSRAAPGALGCEEALRLSPPAGALILCPSPENAEKTSQAVCGFSEIARERHRAAHAPTVPQPRPPADPETVLVRFTAWERSRLAEGLGYVTARRITEELDLTTPEALVLYRTRCGRGPRSAVWPLWRLAEG